MIIPNQYVFDFSRNSNSLFALSDYRSLRFVWAQALHPTEVLLGEGTQRWSLKQRPLPHGKSADETSSAVTACIYLYIHIYIYTYMYTGICVCNVYNVHLLS